MNQIYQAIGISKQAAHQYARRQEFFDEQIMVLVGELEDLRQEHPGCGLEKAYYTLKPDFLGRDRFIELFKELGYKVMKKRNYKRTTYSVASNYSNLIVGLRIHAPCMVWQSDITYIAIDDKFYYAVFIIDVYTKKITGYALSDHLQAEANVQAIQMAFKYNNAPQIHHSDKGSQYVYKGYIGILKSHHCKISMSGSAQENAYAERINRTIKEEYLDYWKPKNFHSLKQCIHKAVHH